CPATAGASYRASGALREARDRPSAASSRRGASAAGIAGTGLMTDRRMFPSAQAAPIEGHNKRPEMPYLGASPGRAGEPLQCRAQRFHLAIKLGRRIVLATRAALEQRIGRVYRLGQSQPIDVFNLVCEQGIESRIAGLVGSGQAFFKGLFDGDSDSVRFEQSGSFLSRVEKTYETAAA